MNRTKKCNYNRIKYVTPQNQQDGEGLDFNEVPVSLTVVIKSVDKYQ